MDKNWLFYFSFYYLFCLGVIYWYSMPWLERGVLLPLQHSAALCPCLPQFWHFPLKFPCDIPSSIDTQPDLSYCNGIKTGFFFRLFYAYDWPTVASVDPSSSAACIAALRSQGFYACTQAYFVGSKPSINRNIASFKSILAY